MTELQKRYEYHGPMSESNHADLMARINAARREINSAIGANYTEVILFAIGRITPTPDAQMPAVVATGGEWTGD
jgi:hypothetical protein